MSGYNKPLPVVSEGARPYWEGCKAGRLRLPKCRSCGTVFFFPAGFCPACLREEIEWIDASGRGVVHAFSVISRPASPAFSDDVPYVVAIIELKEGPRMMSNFVGIDPARVHVGLAVEVTFERVTDQITLPKFKPAV